MSRCRGRGRAVRGAVSCEWQNPFLVYWMAQSSSVAHVTRCNNQSQWLVRTLMRTITILIPGGHCCTHTCIHHCTRKEGIPAGTSQLHKHIHSTFKISAFYYNGTVHNLQSLF